MSDALVDFASLDAQVVDPAAGSETVVDETPEVDSEVVETPTEVVEGAEEGTETETTNADGSEKTPEQVETFKKAAAAKAESDKAIDTKATPDNVRKALKAMRDAKPENADVVKQLHGSFERWNAAKAIFPKGVQEMQEAKQFIESVGGPEGYAKMQEAADAVAATDELLYAADSRLWDNVIDDLKSSGHPEALGKLAPSFLAKLKNHDSQAYYDTFTPHFFEGIKEVGLDVKLKQINDALNAKNEKGESAPNYQMLAQIAKIMGDWYADLEKTAKPVEPTDSPERKKFLEEKAAFEATKTEDAKRKTQEFQNGVAEECDKNNNRVLGKHLGSFLNMPFFKDFPYETKVDLGNGIKTRFYEALKADKAYQTQIGSMWKQKSPDRAKIVAYHNAKLEAIANDIVTKTIQSRYPGYAKGGSAAGRVAAATAKKAVATKAAATSVSTGKPVYIAARPNNLIRDAIKVGDKEYSASDLVTLQIAGKGFVKSTDGKSYRYITWRK
jgi:hypothetical protein